MSEQQELTLHDFVEIIKQEYKNHRMVFDVKDVEQARFTDLNYSVRVKVVTSTSRDVGVGLNKDDFNHVVVGRLSVADAHLFIQKKVKEAKTPKSSKTVYDLLSVTHDQPLEARLTEGGLIFTPQPFKF